MVNIVDLLAHVLPASKVTSNRGLWQRTAVEAARHPRCLGPGIAARRAGEQRRARTVAPEALPTLPADSGAVIPHHRPSSGLVSVSYPAAGATAPARWGESASR